MLEIFLLVLLCIQMGKILRAKGYERPIWMQIGVVAGWMVGAFCGALVYGVVYALRHGIEEEPSFGFAMYASTILGAALMECVLFGTVWLLKSKVPPPLPPREISRDIA